MLNTLIFYIIKNTFEIDENFYIRYVKLPICSWKQNIKYWAYLWPNDQNAQHITATSPARFWPGTFVVRNLIRLHILLPVNCQKSNKQ